MRRAFGWIGVLLATAGCDGEAFDPIGDRVMQTDAAVADPTDGGIAGSTDAGSLVTDAGTSGAPADMVALLELMNIARAETGSPPMTWNSAVADNAAAWADQCVWEHSARDQRRLSGVQLGENLSATTRMTATPVSMGQGWIDEIADYDCSANTCAPDGVCGHYTQIIWRDSTEVGCSVINCTQGSPFGGGGWRYLVCQYMPAGNFIGRRPIPVADCP